VFLKISEIFNVHLELRSANQEKKLTLMTCHYRAMVITIKRYAWYSEVWNMMESVYLEQI
jgi:hypothetical protein